MSSLTSAGEATMSRAALIHKGVGSMKRCHVARAPVLTNMKNDCETKGSNGPACTSIWNMLASYRPNSIPHVVLQSLYRVIFLLSWQAESESGRCTPGSRLQRRKLMWHAGCGVGDNIIENVCLRSTDASRGDVHESQEAREADSVSSRRRR